MSTPDAPAAEPQRTNLGPEVDEAVAGARRRMRTGAGPDYDLLAANFDVLHYLLQRPALIDDPDVDLVAHFLEHGRDEGLSPHPDFSMVEYTNRYPVKTAPDRVRNPFLYWLKHGRAAGDIAEPAPDILRMAPIFGLTPRQLADQLADRRRDLQQRLRTGRLGELIAHAAEIEPLIGSTWTQIARPHLVPLSRRTVTATTLALYRAHEAAGFRRARLVLTLGRGGPGRTLAERIVRALEPDRKLDPKLDRRLDPGEIVVLHTDGPPATPWPGGVREIDLAAILGEMPPDRAQYVLVMLLRTFAAEAIVNVDSELLYESMIDYGKALADSERIFLAMSANRQQPLGNWDGAALRWVYPLLDQVAGIITDGSDLCETIIEHHQLAADARERIHVFDTTAAAASALAGVLLTDTEADQQR